MSKKERGPTGTNQFGEPLTQEKVIENFKSIHGDLYDYSEFVFVNTKTKGLIKCNNCGGKKYSNYSKHYDRKQGGCNKCDPARVSKARFQKKQSNALKRLESSPNFETTDYSQFIFKGTAGKCTFVCTKHDTLYQQTYSDHLYTGSSCPLCTKEKREATCLQKVIDYCQPLYGDRFNYENTKCSEIDYNMWVDCKKHGMVEVSRHRHKKLGYCRLCSYETQTGLYSKDTLTDEKLSEPAKLYYITLQSGKRKFDKIGITQLTLEQRFQSFNMYRVTIKNVKEFILSECIDKEQEAMSVLEQNNLLYKTHDLKAVGRGGWTECFKHNAVDFNYLFN